MNLYVEASCNQGRTDHQIMTEVLLALVRVGLVRVAVTGADKAIERASLDARELTETRLYAHALEQKLGEVPRVGDDVTADDLIAAHARALIARHGTKKKAAEVLGVGERTIYRWTGGTPSTPEERPT